MYHVFSRVSFGVRGIAPVNEIESESLVNRRFRCRCDMTDILEEANSFAQ